MRSENAMLAVITGRENALYPGLTASDCDVLGDVFSDDLVYVHSTEITETKAENLVGQRSGLYVHGPITPLGGTTCVLGDVAVTSGAIDMVNVGGVNKGTIRLQEA
jgi:hypothetical protein